MFICDPLLHIIIHHIYLHTYILLFPFIIINGVNYPSSNLEKVNLFVHKGKRDKAIKELMDVTNIDLATATDAVNRWNEIW